MFRLVQDVGVQYPINVKPNVVTVSLISHYSSFKNNLIMDRIEYADNKLNILQANGRQSIYETSKNLCPQLPLVKQISALTICHGSGLRGCFIVSWP